LHFGARFAKAYLNAAIWSCDVSSPVSEAPARVICDPVGRIIMSTSRRLRHHVNQVERLFTGLTRKKIQRGVHTSVRQLKADIRTFIDLYKKNPEALQMDTPQTRSWLLSNASATKPSKFYVAKL
jgi:hypothetical protein